MKQSQQTIQHRKESPIMLCAILSYINPLHHPTSAGTVWAMHSDRPVNYRPEVDPSEDQRIREDKSVHNQQKKEEVDKPSKDDENIDVPDTKRMVPLKNSSPTQKILTRRKKKLTIFK